jgi:hypothetical protein
MLGPTMGAVPVDRTGSPAMPFDATTAAVHRPGPAAGHDRTAFEIGWDHAHHRLVPSADHLHAGHPVRQGWEAGQAVFGLRTLQATPQVRKWLQLRLNAWHRGKAFEGTGVTPAFLKRIAVAACPITGEALTHGTGTPCDASVDRVNNGAGYAVGNLAVMSVRANAAKSDHDWRDAAGFARQIEVGRLGRIDGLTAAQWARLAVLTSFCTPLPHAEAAALPLLLMPPPRLRVLNPVQVLQVLLTLRFMGRGQPARVDRVAALFPPALRHAVRDLMALLLARRIAAGPCPSEAALQRAMTGAWAEPQVLQRWRAVSVPLTAELCEQIVERLVAHRLASVGWRCLPLAHATEGWALASGGRVAPQADPLDIVPLGGDARPMPSAPARWSAPVAGRAEREGRIERMAA